MKKKEKWFCSVKECNKQLSQDFEQWFLTVKGVLKSYCQKHYNIMEKKVNKHL